MSAPSGRWLWKSLPLLAVAGLSVLGTRRLVEATSSLVAGPVPAALPEAPVPFLQKWCYDCHGDGARKGGFAMDGPQPLTDADWDKIRRHVLLRTMPPEDEPAPPAEALEQFGQELLAWQASLPEGNAAPGRRRLSRREFTNSLRDLIGAAPALTDLPDEEAAHGFDNNGDFQPLPPTVLERYVTVTGEVLRAALLPPPVPVRMQRVMTQEFTGSGGPSPDAPAFYEVETAGKVSIPVMVAAGGSYRFSLRVYAHQAGEGPVLAVLQGSAPQPVRAVDRFAPETLQAVVDLPPGASQLTFQLANPLHDPSHPDPHRRTRRLLVQEALVEGPLEGDTTPAAALVRRFGQVPERTAPLAERLAWLASAGEAFAGRAWRRPPTRGESFRLAGLAGEATARGLRPDESLVLVLQAVLTSPHFLFLPDPGGEAPGRRSYAVAARLSHLLWSTLPDEALLAEAAAPWTAERLTQAAGRLLDDPRAAALPENFAGQWLQLRNATVSRPDAALFPEATPEIRLALQQSAEAFFLHLVRKNEPVLRLLDADYTFMNGPLASWIGEPSAGTEEGFRKVPLTDPDRYGLLGHPAVLMLTSHPNRTSPVLRGKYVLEALLGLTPPPPPPNVPTLQQAATAHGTAALTVRAALEQHRADPSCASCHRAIDPLGFPLEAFDAIGRPSHAPPRDLATTTFTGTPLHRPADLHAWLIQEQGLRIVHHTAERLLTYALGRGLSPAEVGAAHRLADGCGGREAKFRDLLLAVVASPVFRGELPDQKPDF